MSIFEKASRAKLSFKANNGVLSVNDLWDLSLESLNTLAKAVNRELKLSEEENFIAVKSSVNATLELRLDILKRIIEVKLQEREAAKDASAKSERRKAILQVLSEKDDESLKNKTREELLAELDAL